ncbi:MAG: hypothetical protein OXH16_07560 [Gemmatimonadetes bacterium]|nr:hypothetical protein [Gemmatimonadota bacterium]
MLSNISSWVIALIGTSFIIFSTIISAIFLYQTRRIITDEQGKIEEIRRKKDNLWLNHQRGEQRLRDAEIFFAFLRDSFIQKTVTAPNIHFLMDRSIYYFRGAALSMLVASGASGEEEYSKTKKEVDNLLHDFFVADNPKSYEILITKIDSLRIKSANKINELAGSVSDKQSQISSYKNREYVIYLAYVFLNLLGISLTMCKDLPIWKKQN